MKNVIHGLHIQLCLCMTFTVLAKLSVQEKPISSVILFLYSPIIVMSSALKEGKKNKITREHVGCQTKSDGKQTRYMFMAIK